MFPNINCKQFMFRNIPFLIFMVSDFSLKINSEHISICTKFSNCRWMKWLKLTFQMVWKTVESQRILKTILSGNPDIRFIVTALVLLHLILSSLIIKLFHMDLFENLQWAHSRA